MYMKVSIIPWGLHLGDSLTEKPLLTKCSGQGKRQRLEKLFLAISANEEERVEAVVETAQGEGSPEDEQQLRVRFVLRLLQLDQELHVKQEPGNEKDAHQHQQQLLWLAGMDPALLLELGADEVGTGTDDHQGHQETQQEVNEGHSHFSLQNHSLPILGAGFSFPLFSMSILKQQ